MPDTLSFDLPPASKEDINKIGKSLKVNKAIESDGIPLKLIKFSANVVEKYLTSIINHGISWSYFSDGAKNALIRPSNYNTIILYNGLLLEKLKYFKLC